MNPRRVSKAQMFLMIFAAGLIGGCVGSGEVLNVDLRVLRSPDSVSKAPRGRAPLSAFVRVFEDRRAQGNRLGTRTHFWGGTTSFVIEGGHAGEKMTRVLADYLQQRGVIVGVEAPGVAGIKGTPDIIVSGTVEDLSANAKSRFGSTLMVTTLKLTMHIQHVKDSRMTGLQVDDVREDSVGWFEPEDLENLANRMIQESLGNVLDDLNLARMKTTKGQGPRTVLPPIP